MKKLLICMIVIFLCSGYIKKKDNGSEINSESLKIGVSIDTEQTLIRNKWMGSEMRNNVKT